MPYYNNNKVRNQSTNPFYTPISLPSNYETHVPGVFASPQREEEKSMSSLQRAMYRKNSSQLTTSTVSSTSSSIGQFSYQPLSQPSESYEYQNNSNNDSNRKYFKGKNSRRNKNYERSNNYSYSSGHSYTIGGAKPNTSNHQYNNTNNLPSTVKTTNPSSAKKSQSNKNNNKNKKKNILKVVTPPIAQQGNKGKESDGQDSISIDGIDAKYLETIGKLTSQIETLEESKTQSDEMVNKLQNEVSSLKESNLKLQNELQFKEDAKQDEMMEASKRTVDLLKAASEKADLEHKFSNEKQQMQQEISRLTNELQTTKNDLASVLKLLRSMNDNQKTIQDMMTSTNKQMDDSARTEMKLVEEASQKIETTIKAASDEHLQIAELLKKQRMNMDLIGEEQNRISQFVSNQMIQSQGSLGDHDINDVFGRQKSAMESAIQLLGSVASS